MQTLHRTRPSIPMNKLLSVAAILCPLALTGCSTSFWKTAKAAEASTEESSATAENAASTTTDDDSTPSSDTLVVPAATENATSSGSEKPAPSSESTAFDAKPVSVESELETLRSSLSRTANFRKNRTKKADAAYVKEATLQIDRGLAAATDIIKTSGASLESRREAWKGRFTLLSRGEQLKLAEFSDRLDAAVAEAMALPEFQVEAEYGSGLLLLNRYFRNSRLQDTLEQLQTHARKFPNGATTARLFITYARNCGERGNFNAGILCCNLALWQLNNHPDVGAIRNLQENLKAGRTVDPSLDKVQQRLEKEVAELRSVLPIRIDKVTTCTSITTSYHAIHYSFQVTAFASAVRKNRGKLEKSVTELAQTTPQTRQLLDRGVALHYSYFDRDGNTLVRFTVKK